MQQSNRNVPIKSSADLYNKKYFLSTNGNINFLKYSLMDFIQNDELDNMLIKDRISMFASFLKDCFDRKYYQYRRESLTGAGPIMTIRDMYSKKEFEMINLASNDYLNLTKHPKVIDAGVEAMKKYGSGAGSVPLLSGTLDIHKKLEEKTATLKGCESSIIFTSGFGANVAFLSTILRKNDVAVMDMFVHASLIEGCKNTNKLFFRHNNMDSLEKVLKKASKKYRNIIVVVDGVYSMDGDIARLDEVTKIAHSYNALVMVDEAHATGVVGKTGKGTPEHFNIEGKVDIVAGTYSKALGGVGGFVATSKDMVSYLEFLARPYMFSTAPAPSVTASLIEAINIFQSQKELREKLWRNINYFRKNLISLGFDLGNSETAIFPIIIGDPYKVHEICRCMHESRVFVNPVVYPAVPARLSRIRMSICAGLETHHLDKVLELIETFGKKYGVI